MKIRTVLLNTAVFGGVSLLVLAATYLVDLWLLPSIISLSPTDALFIEGIMFLIFGLLFLLGRGGINRASISAAILASETEAIYGRDVAGPNEILRQDAWKARGFTRTGLMLIFSGLLMILAYFLSL